jgi:hypothetical protein
MGAFNQVGDHILGRGGDVRLVAANTLKTERGDDRRHGGSLMAGEPERLRLAVAGGKAVLTERPLERFQRLTKYRGATVVDVVGTLPWHLNHRDRQD